MVAALGLHDLDDVVDPAGRSVASRHAPEIRLVPAGADLPIRAPQAAPPASVVGPASVADGAHESDAYRSPAAIPSPSSTPTDIDEVAALAELFGTTKAPVGLRSVPERGADEDGADDLEVRRLAEFFSRG